MLFGVMFVMLMCIHITTAAPGIEREIITAQRNPGCKKIFFFLISPCGDFCQQVSVCLSRTGMHMGLNVLLLMHRSTKDSVNVVFRHFVISVSA